MFLSAAAFGEPLRSATYTGTIGKTLDIHAKLEFRNGEITGSYFYDKNKVEIPLKGRVIPGGFQMQELNAHGDVTGIFDGKEISILELQGNWRKPGRKKNFLSNCEPIAFMEAANRRDGLADGIRKRTLRAWMTSSGLRFVGGGLRIVGGV